MSSVPSPRMHAPRLVLQYVLLCPLVILYRSTSFRFGTFRFPKKKSYVSRPTVGGLKASLRSRRTVCVKGIDHELQPQLEVP